MKTADAIYYIDSRKPEAEELLSLAPVTASGPVSSASGLSLYRK